MTHPLHAYMQRISSSLVEHAVAVMPTARKEWARAMRAELASLDVGNERIRWSFGCLCAAYSERVRSFAVLDRLGMRILDSTPELERGARADMECQARVGIPHDPGLGGALSWFRKHSGVCGRSDAPDRPVLDFGCSLCGGCGIPCASSAERGALLRGCSGDRTVVAHWFFLGFRIPRFLVCEKRGFALRSLAWIYGTRADNRKPLSTRRISAEPRTGLTLEQSVLWGCH